MKKDTYSAWSRKTTKRENPIEKVKRIGRNIMCIYQRTKYGYCFRDVWSIDYWFLNVVPGMLKDLKNAHQGVPCCGDEGPGNPILSMALDADSEKWDEILEKMIFLFEEANPDKCQYVNPYEEEYQKVKDEFENKYGSFGEKLLTEDEKKGPGRVIHWAHELPENKGIHKKYMEEYSKIQEYQNKCKNEAFELFSKWFWALWD